MLTIDRAGDADEPPPKGHASSKKPARAPKGPPAQYTFAATEAVFSQLVIFSLQQRHTRSALLGGRADGEKNGDAPAGRQTAGASGQTMGRAGCLERALMAAALAPQTIRVGELAAVGVPRRLGHDDPPGPQVGHQAVDGLLVAP